MADETYTLIQRNTLTASASSITLSSIPQTFTDLVVKISSRCDVATTQANSFIRPNAATTGYREVAWYFYNGTVYTTTAASTSIYYSYATGANTLANTYSSNEIYISNYSSTTLFKQFSVDSTVENNNTGTGYVIINDGGTWASASQMTSLYLSPESGNYIAGTTVSLYGIAKYGVSPVAGPKALGGDIITNDGTYWIHQFLNSGTFTPSQTLSTEYLVVAGGGGGGGFYGGGGGAGGYRTNVGSTALSVTAQAYPITVGAGGAGGVGESSHAGKGVDSAFSTITSTGGGGARIYNTSTGGDGGSGAGGQRLPGFLGNTPSTTPSQGNNGGDGYSASQAWGSGGGGGAGAVGTNGNSSTGGAGGNGSASSITGTSVTRGGGGGGGQYNGGTGPAGGSGGGGAAGSGSGNGTAGSANTGGGGGGGSYSGTQGSSGGAGGSGIVIIRYAMA